MGADSTVDSHILHFGRNVFCVVIAAALFLVVVVAPFLSFPCKKPLSNQDWLYLLIAAIIGVLIALVSRVLAAKASFLKSRKAFVIAVAVCCLVLLVWQAAAVHGGWFKTNWDVKAITAFKHYKKYEGYFSMYPPAVFLAGLMSHVARIGRLLGFSNGYLCAVAGGCISVTASVALVSFTARRIGGYAVGYSTLGIAAVLVGISPWFLVPYSDVYAMFWVALIFFAAACVKRAPLKWGLIAFSAVFGYAVKPTVVFAVAAVVLVEICVSVSRLRRTSAGKDRSGRSYEGHFPAIMKTVVAIGMCCAVGFAVVHEVSDIGIDIKEEKALSATHFLMMGFNPTTKGVYSKEDVDFSKSFSTKAERSAANLDIWRQRVSDLGLGGVEQLMVAKALCVFADGTFAWECEGNFYLDTRGTDELVKSIYGIDDSDSSVVRAVAIAPLLQCAWMLVLAGCVLCLFRRRPSNAECAMAIALVMLIVFLLLFECRARYLLLYVPEFCALAALGWRALPLARLRQERKGPVRD